MEENYVWILSKNQPTSRGHRNVCVFNDRDLAVNFIKMLMDKVDEVLDVTGNYSIVDCIETGMPTCYYLERCIIR